MKRTLFLIVYVSVVIGSFLLAVSNIGGIGSVGRVLLVIFGIPWSLLVVMFGWLVIHAGGSKALEWLLLLSAVPNFVLILRSFLLKFVKDNIEV